MSENRIEGAFKKMGGDIKEGIGNLTGDAKLQTEGKLDQAEGRAQNAIGGVEDALDERREDIIERDRDRI